MLEKNSHTHSYPLFLEDVYDALRAAIQALGGPKVVSSRLWPHKPVEQARKELLDALNRDNPRKLDPEETLAILRMAREVGFHGAKHWIDAELGYENAAPLDPVIQKDRLAEELARAADTFERLTREVQKMTSTPPSASGKSLRAA